MLEYLTLKAAKIESETYKFYHANFRKKKRKVVKDTFNNKVFEKSWTLNKLTRYKEDGNQIKIIQR